MRAFEKYETVNPNVFVALQESRSSNGYSMGRTHRDAEFFNQPLRRRHCRQCRKKPAISQLSLNNIIAVCTVHEEFRVVEYLADAQDIGRVKTLGDVEGYQAIQTAVDSSLSKARQRKGNAHARICVIFQIKLDVSLQQIRVEYRPEYLGRGGVPELAIFFTTFSGDPLNCCLALFQGLIQLAGYSKARCVRRLEEGCLVGAAALRHRFAFEKVEKKHGLWISRKSDVAEL
jgi:hypothetical protein